MYLTKGVYFCSESSYNRVFSGDIKSEIEQRLDMYQTVVTRENWHLHKSAISEAEVILSSWEGAILDRQLLDAMPKLKMYFYAAGTIQELMTEEAWDRGVRITNAVDANATPVAEFCLAQILFSLKHGWKYMRFAKSDRPDLWQCNKPVPGNFRSRVGLISFGTIAKKTCALLKHFDLEVLVSTGHKDPILAEKLGIRYASTEHIFKTCDVISLHMPSNERTYRSIGNELFNLMKPGATLINTARGAVIRQDEMVQFLKKRKDVTACIDVTDPEPPEFGCPLFEMDNVVLTPHLAGSMGGEAARLAAYMVEEIDLYLAGKPLKWELSREAASNMA